MTFEETKKRKLERMLGLRIMHYMGMVSWIPDDFDEAKQYLRLFHPFTWFWIIIAFFAGSVMKGVPETVRDIKYSIINDTVWW